MRRTWIKLYVDQILRGSCFDELLPDERFVWFGFLLLAGDNACEGEISITKTMGYTKNQLAELLKCEVELIGRSVKKMIKVDKINVLEGGIIKIINWQRYQSEYQRLRKYKKSTKKGTKKSTAKGIMVDIDRDIDKKEKKNKNKEIIKEIILYLNKKTGKNFRQDSKIVVKNITARLNEKYTLDDFKKVIDIKCSHWLNPKKGEPDMSIYLSPDTLFGNKFEKYLNQNANKEAIKKAVDREQDWDKIKEKRDDYKWKPKSPKIKEEVDKILEGKIIRHNKGG